MPAVKPVGDDTWALKCPACGYRHTFDGEEWHWNGDRNNPTVTPSIHVMPGSKAECHFYVEDGEIRYLRSSSHDLAGESVELPEI